MSVLFDLINISHYYGRNPAYVIAGGGNTSYKTSDKLWVKSSGIPLAEIGEDGFVCLEREKLKLIAAKKYPADVTAREKAVMQDLMAAVMSSGVPEGGKAMPRPSVETSLHNILQHSFVVHTHPTLVNALLCAAGAREKTEELFGNDILYIEYTDPGYTLFIKTSQELNRYRHLHGSEPQVIFLQNHGMIVGADNIDSIISLTDNINRNIEEHISKALPDPGPGRPGKTMEELLKKLSVTKGRNYTGARSSLIDFFVSSSDIFEGVSRPFTPDDIVYCRSEYLFVNRPAELNESIDAFVKANAYYPHIIAIKDNGIIAAGTSHEQAGISLDIFINMMKVSFLSHNFGGPKPLTNRQISFIENWESENYRRNKIKKK